MKKFFITFITTLVFAFSFIGCSNPSDSTPTTTTTYKIEFGVVSNSTYTTAVSMASSYGANITHENMKTIRDYLDQNTTSNDYDSTTGVTKDKIRDFLTQHGMTAVQANAEIACLETLGNDIAFFEYADSSSSKVWMYAEKE